MNYFQIIGAVLSICAAILMLIGTYQQAKKDAQFQYKVEDLVDEQKKLNEPELAALSIKGKNSDYELIVKNIGNKPARQVKLIFSENSYPSAFSANMISGTDEILGGIEYPLSLNLFSGIEMLMKSPNSDENYKKKLVESWNKFVSGEKVFIPRFYLEYYFENKRIISKEYFLVIDHEKRITYFGKVE